MIIPVKVDEDSFADDHRGASAGPAVPEWSMVELQGELTSKSPLTGQSLGTMAQTQGKRVLVIGKHCLEGKETTLDKPLLVLKKVVVQGSHTDGAEQGPGAAGGQGKESDGEGLAQTHGGAANSAASGRAVEYRIVGKITKKSLFKERPKALVRKIGVA